MLPTKKGREYHTEHVLPSLAVWGNAPMTLAEIYRPEVNLAILERVMQDEVTAYAAFICSRPERIAFVRMLSMQEIKPTLKEYLPSHANVDVFIQDVESAATVLGCLFDTDNVGLRLHSVDNAPCPRFHTDKLACRLLLTYHGRGTQWLDENNLDRNWLGPAKPGDDERNICLDASRINEIGCGHIAICKGEGWEGNEGRGLVHRSPPPLSNMKRLVLTIDVG